MNAASRPALVYSFGRLEVDLGRRELRRSGAAVVIGGRALEILDILLQSRGELVTKDELMRRVWPGALVEENTLEVHISTLRKALGSDRGVLKTSYTRGYRLAGEWRVAQSGGSTDATPMWPARRVRNNLPISGSRMIGRDHDVRELCDLLFTHRTVTLTGLGGIGKTRLAMDVAVGLANGFEGDIWLVEFASLSDPGLVPSEVANVLGRRANGDRPSADDVARCIGDERMLLILDNCEHVIEAAAALTDTIMRLCPGVTIMATSREALRIDGERVYHVPSLDVPLQGMTRPGDMLECSSAQLFIARARALVPDFAPPPADMLAIAEICWHLDGIPLAIEFAAARAATIGVARVAAGLADRFLLLTIGLRPALPRQQTLRATLDWSYDLLNGEEAATLRRLGVFAGGFSLDAAVAVAGDLPRQVVVDCVTNLVSKSLVIALPDGVPQYRLFETMRFYALEKLCLSDEHAQTTRRQEEHHLALSARPRRERGTACPRRSSRAAAAGYAHSTAK